MFRLENLQDTISAICCTNSERSGKRAKCNVVAVSDSGIKVPADLVLPEFVGSFRRRHMRFIVALGNRLQGTHQDLVCVELAPSGWSSFDTLKYSLCFFLMWKHLWRDFQMKSVFKKRYGHFEVYSGHFKIIMGHRLLLNGFWLALF